jgi:RsiW-degrading membrane proteinase PrsW (M82 family)
VIRYFKQFDEPVDGIIYSSVLALGFASFENLQHLTYLSGFELFGRAVAGPLVHTIFASIWGYTTGITHLRKGRIFLAAAAGLGLASILHGLYDFLTTSTSSRLAAALLILLVWIWRIGTLEKKGGKRACR